MIITAKADGTLIKTVPDRVYQGSNNADTIIVIAPIIQTAVMNIRFKLPQINEYTENFLMTPANQSIYADLGVSVWAYPITSALTQYYGTVQAQFSATVNGAIVSSGQFTFDVEKGVEVVLPDPEEPNHTYDDIYNYLQNMSTKIFINGELQAKAILPYDATFKYGLGATLFDNGRFYTSLVANNQNNALTDATKWQETRFYTKSETDTIIADMELAISNIIDGTTPVAEATHAESATNVSIINNDSGNNANINFSIGTGSYNKTVNNVANANTAINYAVGGSIDSELKLIKQIALDRENALVFANNQQIIDWIAGDYERPDGKTVSDLTIGLTIYNQDATQADYWVSQLPVTSISDLTPFDSDVNPLDAINVEFDASINENKLEADNVQEAIDELTNIAEEKTNIYELGQFTLESTDWALNSTSGLYEYIFTNEYLTSATNEIIEVTPSVESAKLINSNNLVIYNDIEIRQGVSAVEAVIKAQSAPSFDIVCYVRLKTVAMRLSGAGSLHASQVIFVNTGTGLGATNVQSVITEINTKADTNASSIGTLSSLDTTVKTDLVSAVNEVNTNKQNSTDNTLTTTNKTVVGAINELNSNKEPNFTISNQTQSGGVTTDNDVVLDKTNAVLSANLNSTLKGKINNSLQKPSSAPAQVQLVGIDTSGNQTSFNVSDFIQTAVQIERGQIDLTESGLLSKTFTINGKTGYQYYLLLEVGGGATCTIEIGPSNAGYSGTKQITRVAQIQSTGLAFGLCKTTFDCVKTASNNVITFTITFNSESMLVLEYDNSTLTPSISPRYGFTGSYQIWEVKNPF